MANGRVGAQPHHARNGDNHTRQPDRADSWTEPTNRTEPTAGQSSRAQSVLQPSSKPAAAGAGRGSREPSTHELNCVLAHAWQPARRRARCAGSSPERAASALRAGQPRSRPEPRQTHLSRAKNTSWTGSGTLNPDGGGRSGKTRCRETA